MYDPPLYGPLAIPSPFAYGMPSPNGVPTPGTFQSAYGIGGELAVAATPATGLIFAFEDAFEVAFEVAFEAALVVAALFVKAFVVCVAAATCTRARRNRCCVPTLAGEEAAGAVEEDEEEAVCGCVRRGGEGGWLYIYVRGRWVARRGGRETVTELGDVTGYPTAFPATSEQDDFVGPIETGLPATAWRPWVVPGRGVR